MFLLMSKIWILRIPYPSAPPPKKKSCRKTKVNFNPAWLKLYLKSKKVNSLSHLWQIHTGECPWSYSVLLEHLTSLRHLTPLLLLLPSPILFAWLPYPLRLILNVTSLEKSYESSHKVSTLSTIICFNTLEDYFMALIKNTINKLFM